jgi:hypothetical protein
MVDPRDPPYATADAPIAFLHTIDRQRWIYINQTQEMSGAWLLHQENESCDRIVTHSKDQSFHEPNVPCDCIEWLGQCYHASNGAADPGVVHEVLLLTALRQQLHHLLEKRKKWE